jgi:hypothetical protein
VFEIGAALRDARERQGLERADVERELRIRESYLAALEEERFDRTPVTPTRRGFFVPMQTSSGSTGNASSTSLASAFQRRVGRAADADACPLALAPSASSRTHGQRVRGEHARIPRLAPRTQRPRADPRPATTDCDESPRSRRHVRRHHALGSRLRRPRTSSCGLAVAAGSQFMSNRRSDHCSTKARSKPFFATRSVRTAWGAQTRSALGASTAAPAIWGR